MEQLDVCCKTTGASLPWRARRSVRRYRPEPIPQGIIDQLLEAAVTAPSAHNRQPWRFATLSSNRLKATLARAMGDRLREDRRGDKDPSADIEADVARSFARITGAATVVIVCLSMEDMDVYPDVLRNRIEHQMAVQSTAMAGQNFLLTAHAAGLGACWLCAPMFCPDTVCNSLGLPGHREPQGMITIGYPIGPDKPAVRRSMSDVAMLLTDAP
jgi:F420 biosynthesis protein FbiB-like protein